MNLEFKPHGTRLFVAQINDNDPGDECTCPACRFEQENKAAIDAKEAQLNAEAAERAKERWLTSYINRLDEQEAEDEAYDFREFLSADGGDGDDDEDLEGEVFEPGDVVILKSGGIPMTIATILITGRVECVWHDESGFLQREAFEPIVLESVPA